MPPKNLFTSLALATLLIVAPGLSTVAVAHDDHDKPHHGMMHHGMMMCGAEHLTKDQSKLLHDTLQPLHDKDHAQHEQMHKLHQSLQAALEAQPFDKSAFLSLVTQMDDLHNQMKTDHMQAFASIADQFSPKERPCVATMFMHHHGLHHGEFRGHDHAAWHHEGRFEHAEGEANHRDGTAEALSAPLVNTAPVMSQREYPPYAPR